MGAYHEITTKRNYSFGEVSSAMQKAIRRADARLAGYWAIELFESGFHDYVWRRLYTISAEDVYGIITQEIRALHTGFELVNANRAKGTPAKGRVFISKAVILLSMASKSRDADHLTNLVYDKIAVAKSDLLAELEGERGKYEPIPGYAYDVHTLKGRIRGATKAQFFREEQKALSPLMPGLFDGDVK